MADGVEVPFNFLMDNLRKRFNILGKIYEKKVQGGGRQGF